MSGPASPLGVTDPSGVGWAFAPDAGGVLRQLAFGPTAGGVRADLPLAAYPLALPTYGEDPLRRSALRVTHADGSSVTRLVYSSGPATPGPATPGPATPDTPTHVIGLHDPVHPLAVTLCFHLYGDGVATQWMEVTNHQDGPIRVHDWYSAAPALPGNLYWTHSGGGWAAEWTPTSERLTPGLSSVESLGGVQPHLQTQPFFTLAFAEPATESTGLVVAGAIGWGGNTSVVAEVPAGHGATRLLVGANPYAASVTLDPGDTLVTPWVLWAWSTEGTGPLSRRLHRWVRTHGVRDGDRTRATVMNNWEATFFSFDTDRLIGLMDGAHRVGAELFLLDDGWFGSEYPRDDDHRGLGDWVTDHRKLPGGLGDLEAAAAERSLRFGLWFEPEMVNPLSGLYREHPDWVVSQPGVARRESRQQLVLDPCRPEVRAFVVGTFDRVLGEHPTISYVKWDANRPVTEPGSVALPPDRQEDWWYLSARHTDEMMAEVARRHPDVEMMLCASGGGRVDLASLRHFHEVWLSDNTDPVTRARMQWTASTFLPALAVGAHVTRWGERPLDLACVVAMFGRFGFDLDTAALDPEDLGVCTRAGAAYHRIRDLVQHGDLWRLISPLGSDRLAVAYLAPDRSRMAVLCAQLEGRPDPTDRLVLAGLDRDREWSVTELPVRSPLARPRVEAAGAELCGAGLPWPLTEPLSGAVLEVVAHSA